MADENIYDKVVDGLLKRNEQVRGVLNKKFKKTKPFRMEPVSDREALNRYNSMDENQFTELLNTHGQDKMQEYVNQMEELKGRTL